MFECEVLRKGQRRLVWLSIINPLQRTRIIININQRPQSIYTFIPLDQLFNLDILGLSQARIADNNQKCHQLNSKNYLWKSQLNPKTNVSTITGDQRIRFDSLDDDQCIWLKVYVVKPTLTWHVFRVAYIAI